MKSTDEPTLEPLLDPVSLERHFNFVNPTSYKLTLFKISNLYNELKNKEKDKDKSIRKNKIAMQIQIRLKRLLNDVETEEKKPRNAMDAVADGLVLGVIPKSNQIEEIIQSAKKASNDIKSIHIFSITDEFEQGMPEMLEPKDLNRGINNIPFHHHQVPMTDFGADISPQSILAAVYKMRKIIEEGGTVYIHCKAGKARSAMIVSTYLAIYGDAKNKLIIDSNNSSNPPIKQAISHLKVKRSQVDLHDNKIKTWENFMKQDGSFAKLQKAQEAINLHHAISNKIRNETSREISTTDYIRKFNDETKSDWKNIEWQKAPNKKNYIQDIINKIVKKEPAWEFKNGESTFSSLEFKNHLINLTSFKQLKIYATQSQNPLKKTSKHSQYIKDFLKTIYTAKDDNWYNELIAGKGPLAKLIDSSKTTEGIKTIIANFSNDLINYKNMKSQKQDEFLNNQTMSVIQPQSDDSNKQSKKENDASLKKIQNVNQTHSEYSQHRLFSHSDSKTYKLKIEIFKLINTIEKRNNGQEMNEDDKKMIAILEENLKNIKNNQLEKVEDSINKISDQIQSSKKSLSPT